MANRAEHWTEDCNSGNDCVECGGCECGWHPATCINGCWSRDDYDQWCEENGMAWEEGSYG